MTTLIFATIFFLQAVSCAKRKEPASYVKEIITNLDGLDKTLQPFGGIGGTVKKLQAINNDGIIDKLVKDYLAAETRRGGSKGEMKKLRTLADLASGLVDNVGTALAYLSWAGQMVGQMASAAGIGGVSLTDVANGFGQGGFDAGMGSHGGFGGEPGNQGGLLPGMGGGAGSGAHGQVETVDTGAGDDGGWRAGSGDTNLNEEEPLR